MNDWSDLGIFHYEKVCEKCKRKITIIQNGDEISQEALNHILIHAHVKQRYDSYHRFLKINNEEYERIDVDLPGNIKCS